LAVLVHFDIPQAIPFGSSITGTKVAAKVGLPEDIVLRILRFAVTSGYFVEEPAGSFWHNSVSARLAHSKPLRDIALTSTHELLQIFTKLPDALDLLKNSKDGEKPALAFDVAFPGYQKGIFEFVQKNPVAAQHYHAFQSGKVQTSRWSQRNIAEGWDWAAVGSGTIVDVSLIDDLRSFDIDSLDAYFEICETGRRLARTNLYRIGTC